MDWNAIVSPVCSLLQKGVSSKMTGICFQIIPLNLAFCRQFVCLLFTEIFCLSN